MSTLNQEILKAACSISVFGIGKSSLGVIEYIRKHYPNTEIKVRCDALPSYIPEAFRSLEIFSGEDARKSITEDILFLSPTVRRDTPELISAACRGTVLSSDTELFFACHSGPVLSITGSDGKSTTTYLTAKILSESGYAALPAGNYGISLSSKIGSEKTIVTELSSFQLMYTEPPSQRACITGITKNHLNWHRGYSEYIEAKSHILKNALLAVYDFDTPDLRALMCGREVFAVCSFDTGYVELSKRVRSRHCLTYSEGHIFLDGDDYIDISGAKRCEEYNIRNYMLATAMTLGFHTKEALSQIFTEFGGLPHRAELICEINRIKYINSSVDTSPMRTIKTLSAMKGKTVIILGGKAKGLSMWELREPIMKHTVGAVLMGEVAEELRAVLRGTPYRVADSMDEAVRLATELLGGDGTVLLSPAATSFDSYLSFEERGLDFIRAVNGLL